MTVTLDDFRCRIVRRTFVAILCMGWLSHPRVMDAQVVIPAAIQERATGTARIVPTAEEMSFSLALLKVRANASVPLSVERYPVDSLNRLVEDRAADLVQRLRANPIKGIQLDPSGNVAVSGDQDQLARTQIASRLATPGISVDDKGYTLFVAVASFADADHPRRIPIAEEYLRQVDAMPAAADYWKYLARVSLIDANYILGRADAVERLATEALTLVTKLRFIDRAVFYGGSRSAYMAFADVLSGKADGAERIKAISGQLITAAAAPADLVAIDSTYYFIGRQFQSAMRKTIDLGAMIGKTAPKIVGSAWFNTSHDGPFDQPLDDGKIRIIEFGEVTCRPCLISLSGMQRIANRFNGEVEVMYVTNTMGFWGTTFTEPKEEVDSLRAYYTGTRKLTFPIAVWMGEKHETPDGGLLPEGSPNLQTFPITATPTIFVTDGTGRVRRVFVGFGGDDEERATKLLQYLVAEAKQRSATPATAH